MTHGWRSRIINYSRQSRARPLSEKTHISQTHSVTSCRSSVVRLNKYAAFDVCCVIFLFFFASRLQANVSILFSTSRLYPLLVCAVSFRHRALRQTRHAPLPSRQRVSLVSNRTPFSSRRRGRGRDRRSTSRRGRSPSARHAARATTNLSAPHLRPPAKQITICE